MQNVKLTDLIDPEILQQMQDSLSNYIGMAGLIADENGTPVTTGSRFTEFCHDLTRQSALGCSRCEECDKQGALQTLKNGRPTVYHCHAGLVDYAAPIMLEDTFIGSIIGGQVLTDPLEEDSFRQTARELSIDEDTYVAAAKKIPYRELGEVERAASFLSEIASALSSMAYKNYLALQHSRKLERAAHSQTAFIIDMNANIQRDMTHWIESAKYAVCNQDYSSMSNTLDDITLRGTELLSTLKDTMEYAKMNDGEIELNETEYDLRALLNNICARTQKYLQAEDIPIWIHVDDSVPMYLLGDEGRISQALAKALNNAIHYPGTTEITVTACCRTVSYARLLTIEIRDNSGGMTQEELTNANYYLINNDFQLIENMEACGIGLSIIGLLIRQMSGTVKISCMENAGTVYTIQIPQLPAGQA
ncbi:MAG: PocR ligand-binding domain-containing protein [Eubacterium sp.]|nr:PocR ligand-binding domain-containing protein [Eubacterium sp.]